jgi:hypothetical protein
MYADLASETLITTDQGRAEALLKAPGVGVTIGTGRPVPPATAARSPAPAWVAKGAAGFPAIAASPSRDSPAARHVEHPACTEDRPRVWLRTLRLLRIMRMRGGDGYDYTQHRLD